MFSHQETTKSYFCCSIIILVIEHTYCCWLSFHPIALAPFRELEHVSLLQRTTTKATLKWSVFSICCLQKTSAGWIKNSFYSLPLLLLHRRRRSSFHRVSLLLLFVCFDGQWNSTKHVAFHQSLPKCYYYVRWRFKDTFNVFTYILSLSVKKISPNRSWPNGRLKIPISSNEDEWCFMM